MLSQPKHFFLLNFALTNLNCLTNKVFHVDQFCREENISIFSVTESWLQPLIKDSVVNIDGYSLYRQDFVSSVPKFGVCVYVKNNIKVSEHSDSGSFPNTLALHFPYYNLYVLTVYRPPSYTFEENVALIEFIYNFSTNKEFVLMGDFNLPTISWIGDAPYQNLSTCDSMFLDLFQTLGLYQWVREPTFVRSGNILDLILTSDPDRIQDVVVFPPFPQCGHVTIKASYLFQREPPPDRAVKPIYDWAKGKFNRIRSSLRLFDWDFELQHLNIDDVTSLLTNTLNHLARQFIPQKACCTKSSPWSKSVPKQLYKQRTQKWNDYKISRQTHGRHHHITLLRLFNFNEANATLRSAVLKAQINYEENLIQSRSTRPKLFYSYIRSKKQDRPRVGPLMINDELSDDPNSMANTFVDAFASVFVTESPLNPFRHQLCQGILSDVQFDPKDVELHLKSLDADSAMGPDNLHPRLLKECASELAYPLSILFNKSMASGTLPQSWKLSHVCPIYKKGSRSDPLNYRPISLNPIPCKTMERIICKTLFGFMEEHLIFDESQFGFRPNRSVTDQLLLTYDHITYWYDQGQVVDLILFDFVKAFDRVHHQTLIDKLVAIGIAGNLLQWITSFLLGRSMQVTINGHASHPKPVSSGVPQGSVLGPLLFLIFINHICSQIQCKYKMFADDLKLYLHSSAPSPNCLRSLPGMQNNIDLLSSTAASWGLRFSTGKCVHLRFARQRHVQAENLETSIYTLNGNPINQSFSHSDLGVTVDRKLKFDHHTRSIAAKAGGVATNLLKSTINRSPNFMSSLLISDVRPILDFASPVWNLGFLGQTKLLESVQRRWTKQITGLSDLSYAERLTVLGLYSVKGRLLRHDLIYCYRIFHDLSIISPTDLFTMAPTVATRGHRFKIQMQHSQLESRRRFFSCRVIQRWNSLPLDVVDAPSLPVFKTRLHSFLGEILFSF